MPEELGAATVVDMVAGDMPVDEIIEDYPDLRPEDTEQALRLAARSVREGELSLRVVS